MNFGIGNIEHVSILLLLTAIIIFPNKQQGHRGFHHACYNLLGKISVYTQFGMYLPLLRQCTLILVINFVPLLPVHSTSTVQSVHRMSTIIRSS